MNLAILQIKTEKEFLAQALKTFNEQYQNNKVYQEFVNRLNINPQSVEKIEEIPFLPVEFFKSFKISTQKSPFDKIFTSSGTTGSTPSRHYVKNIQDYYDELDAGFEYFFGNFTDYEVLPLLPAYAERSGSSLIEMVNYWMRKTQQKNTEFYLYNHQDLSKRLEQLSHSPKKIILIGVSFALLDFAEKFSKPLKIQHLIETGGMKGRKKEITREELHERLKNAFDLPHIVSEYGMTELLSQAYALKDGVFETPPWMKILIRDPEDPFNYLPNTATGGINIIDLANQGSCSFIAVQDLGRKSKDGRGFEVLGRFDFSDVRGCNLMAL